MIVPVCWIFSTIFTIPLFLIANFDDENFCAWTWHDQWMPKAYSLIWLVLVALSLALMVVLYSRVVYALWFKSDDDNHLTHEQKVSVDEAICLHDTTFTMRLC